MTLKIASYNLWFHRAYPEISQLAKTKDIALLCLQEGFTNEMKKKAGPLKLAKSHDYTHLIDKARLGPPRYDLSYLKTSRISKIFYDSGKTLNGRVGLAIYYNEKLLALNSIRGVKLPLPWQERKGGRTMQVAVFTDKQSGEEIMVCNIHLSNLWAPNMARRKQLKAALEHINKAKKANQPVILAGDFNYPLNRRSLSKLMDSYGLSECGTHEKKRTHTSKLVSGKFDRIFISEGFKEQHYQILPFGTSDHAPVMAELKTIPAQR